jgi:hypothetical protein
MTAFVAFGVSGSEFASWPGRSSDWNVTPLVVGVAILLALRYVLGIRIRLPTIAVAAVGGALFSTISAAEGLPLAMALTALALLITGRLVNRLRHV